MMEKEMEMANPKLADGFTQIANEILEALSRVNLNAYETRVLMFLIRRTFGFKNDKAWISLSQFSKWMGLDRRHVFRALRGLERKGLVVIYRDDKKHPKYGFQRDYDKWKMEDFHKEALSGQVSKRKEKKESAYPDDKLSSNQAPIKYSFKDILRKKRKENLKPQTPFSLFFEEETQTPNPQDFSVKGESPNNGSSHGQVRHYGRYIPFAALTEEEKRQRDEKARAVKEKAKHDLAVLMESEEAKRRLADGQIVLAEEIRGLPPDAYGRRLRNYELTVDSGGASIPS